jgi:hypothetical protein
MTDESELQEQFDKVIELRAERKKHELSAAEVQEKIRQAEELVRKSIKRGVSTGDRIRDLVVLAHGISDDLEETYRACEAQLAGKQGEFVLIRYPQRVRIRYGGELHKSDSHYETHFRIGVLVGERLWLDGHGAVTLPISSCLQGEWTLSGCAMTYGKAPAPGFFGRQFVESHSPSLCHYLTDEWYIQHKNIFFGDAEVKEALAEVRDDTFFAKAAEKLNRLVLQPAPEA